MEQRDLLKDVFGRIEELYAGVADGLDAGQLRHRPGGTGNSIGWLLWHLARIEDDHLADLAGTTQVWHEGWHEQLGLPFDRDDHGYGHTSEQVDQVRVDGPQLLVEYHSEVHRRSLDYLDSVDAGELDRVVDTRWDPPVTAGVRLVSVVGDCFQHLGQASYVKGLLTASQDTP